MIEYDGTIFVGWQKQPTGISVQQVVVDALKKIGYGDASVYGAGRTDAGVHALGQVAHFDLSDDYSHKLHTFRETLNYFMRPHMVRILDIKTVNSNFHARFDATKRSYIYKIICRQSAPLFWQNRAWHTPYNLRVDLMQEAAELLVGYHDFASFRSSNCQAKNSCKTLDSIVITEYITDYEKLIEIKLSARSFLHNQVRIIVGSLHEVGREKHDVDRITQALLSRDRSLTGLTAPACGLYLSSIVYGGDASG